jgi:hypothetical protein
MVGPNMSAARRRSGLKRAKRKASTRWSRRVTETSNALDLEPGVFALADPRENRSGRPCRC